MTKKTTHHQLYWTKDAFTMNYSIYKDGNIVGIINDKNTDRFAKASIFGKKFAFESDGFLKTSMTVIDFEKKKEIGVINFKAFRAKAHVHIFDDQFLWEFTNILSSKWSLKDKDGKPIVSGKSRKEGYCRVQGEETSFLLVVSLIIRNHFTKQGY